MFRVRDELNLRDPPHLHRSILVGYATSMLGYLRKICESDKTSNILCLFEPAVLHKHVKVRIETLYARNVAM